MRISDWSSDVCSSDLTVFTRSDHATLGDTLQITTGAFGAQNFASFPLRDFGTFLFLFRDAAAPFDLLAREALPQRSEERRVGKEGVRTLRFRRRQEH